MEQHQDQQIRSQQRKAEQQLADALYQLGRGLAENAEPDQILQRFGHWQNIRDDFIRNPVLQWLRQRFDLDQLELQLITIGYITWLEPETRSPYLQLHWYEQPPGLSLERALFLSDIQETDKPAALRYLWQHSPACHYRLLQPHKADCLTRPLLLAEDLCHILTTGAPTPEPDNLFSINQAPTNPDPILTASYSRLLSQPPGKLNQLHGQTGAERAAIVAQLAVQHHIPHWYLVDTSHHTELSDDTSYRILRHLYLHSDPGPCYLYWPDLQQYCWQNKHGIRFYRHLLALPHLTLFTDNPADPVRDQEHAIPAEYLERLRNNQPESITTTCYTLNWPDQEAIAASWQALSDQITPECPGLTPLSAEDTRLLATLYRVRPTRICAIADQLVDTPPEQNNLLSTLQRLARQHITLPDPTLASFCQTRETLQDMVLAEETTEQLQEIIDRVKHGTELIHLMPHARIGAQALFWGKPGTGKTMAARAIANELQLPLYQVNLANIASKWIGETEKHLAELFDTAQESHAVLLFDEADAIFAKRSEVESSHDKNANMGVSFLLQRMESYTGLLLLSTNFKSNLDDAFLRRFHAAIEFSMPDATLRTLLWHKVWPAQWTRAQIPTTTELSLLAEKFEFTPSQIVNIAERSVLFAIRDGTNRITGQKLRSAIVRELEKEGAGFLAEQKVADYFSDISGKLTQPTETDI